MTSSLRRLATLAAVGGAMLAACDRPEAAPSDAPAPTPEPPLAPAAAPSRAPEPAAVDPARPLTDLAAWDAATSAQRRAEAESVAVRETDFRLVKLETFSCGGQTHEVAIFSHEKTGLEFVLVPGGTFVMGAPAAKSGFIEESGTEHKVTLTQPFLLCRTECTQAAWAKVMTTNPSHWKGPKLPVDSVSWDDAKRFCANVELELPTEAQWERACRAGTTTAYSFGEDLERAGDFAWYHANSGNRTHQVAEKLPNAFGIYDMHGNVDEWCADWSASYPPGNATDPSGPESGWQRVIRGVSWVYPVEALRSALRPYAKPDYRDNAGGFRPARTVALR